MGSGPRSSSFSGASVVDHAVSVADARRVSRAPDPEQALREQYVSPPPVTPSAVVLVHSERSRPQNGTARSW